MVYIIIGLLKKQSIIYFIPKNVFAGRIHLTPLLADSNLLLPLRKV